MAHTYTNLLTHIIFSTKKHAPLIDEKSHHDQMVSLVERMLALHKKLTAAQTPDEKIILQRQITTTDQQIDQLTYQLYNLTKDEIKIVEESSV